MRLIDADVLMKELDDAIASQKRWTDSAKKNNSGTLFQLAQQAYFTLLECKDCKWFGEIGCAIEIVDDSDRPNENDFCSFAERRTDG